MHYDKVTDGPSADGRVGVFIPGRRRDRAAIRLMAIATALLLVVFFVLGSSRAAFSATAANSSNSLASGTVALTDDDAGAAMFDGLVGLAPLDTEERCVQVQYTGSLDPGPVVVYATGAPSGSLGGFLDLVVEVGSATADPFGSCVSFVPSDTLYAGSLDGFASTHASYATGVAGFDPAGAGEARTFRFRITVQDDPGASGLTTEWGVTWETRSA